MGVIYLIRHKLTGKGYVGQTRGRERHRWTSHKRSNDNTRISAAIRKHGADAFEWMVVERCASDQLNDREAHWIKTLGTLVPAGYNIREGGNASPLSLETRAKISAWGKGRPKSAEHRAKIAAGQMGVKRPYQNRPLSEEHKRRQLAGYTAEARAKIGASARRPCSESQKAKLRATALANPDSKRTFLGRTHTAEARAKMAAAKIGRPRSDETKAKLREAWQRKRNAGLFIRDRPLGLPVAEVSRSA